MDDIERIGAQIHRATQLNRMEESEIERLRASVAELERERDALRAFAQDIMSRWPECGLEGDELQDSAVDAGLLAEERRTASCGDGCQCATIVDEAEFALGIDCYRRTKLLTGKSDE